MSGWILFDSGNRTGLENMQLDDWLARSWFPETRQPVFRLYGWSPHTLSLGFHQSTDDVDTAALSRAGFGIVRRPTGGRAIFHADEITYSVVMDATRLSVDDVYKCVSRVLVTGLRAAGFDVRFTGTTEKLSSHYRDPSSVSCFTASTEYEIQLNGRKVVGSAQRRYSREDGGITALQHGSILTGPQHHRLIEFLKTGHATKLKLENIMLRSSTDLSEAFGMPVDRPKIKACLQEAVMRDLANGNHEVYNHSYFSSRMKASMHIQEYLI